MSIYKRHRFSPNIISYAVWLHYRFSVSHLDQHAIHSPTPVVNCEPLVKPWGGPAEKFPETGRRAREINRLISVALDEQNAWDRRNMRKTAFERIELMNRIDVSR